MEPYLHGSLNNPSKDMLVRSQSTPVHNMLSEQTLGLVDYHVQHEQTLGLVDYHVQHEQTLGLVDYHVQHAPNVNI